MKKQKNIVVELDNDSDESDISAFTNDKVFKGVTKKLMLVNRRFENKNEIVNNISKQSKQNKIPKPIVNLKVEEVNENGMRESNKSHKNNCDENVNNNLTSFRKVNSPLSFRPKILEEIEKVNIEVKQQNKISEEIDSSYDEKLSIKSNRDLNDMNVDIKNLNLKDYQIFSKKDSPIVRDNKSIEKEKSKKETQKIEANVIMNILSSSEGDKEIDDNLNFEEDNPDTNVFWNLNNKIKEENGNFTTKRSNAYNSEQIPNLTSNRLNVINSKFSYKTSTSSQISCTISKIEKGIAILVSNEDQIFTLPLGFLPKNTVPGNSYQISIDETQKVQNKINLIQSMQKKFFKK